MPSDYTSTTHWIDWKYLVQNAIDKGWLPSMIADQQKTAETLAIYIGVETKGHALANLWTTNFRTSGKT